MRGRRIFPYLVLLIPVLVTFGDVLFAGGQRVASYEHYDAKGYFKPARTFAYAQIADGHLPLWNPHSFSGTPFFAAFQPALLYPLNLHYALLPLWLSLNIEIVLHLYLLAALMYAWARDRGMPIPAALFAAVAIEYSGSFFLGVMAVHLAYLDALAWSPLAFLAVDRVLDSRRHAWAFAGATALTMMILAGHPQGVFCTLVALVPYTGVRWFQSGDKARAACRLAPQFGFPPLLAAWQLLPAIALTPETVRAGGLHFIHASSLSFPPENLLSMPAPTILGDSIVSPYYGRWVYWEVCAFMGAATISLAAFGVIAGNRKLSVLCGTLVLATALIALGRYTPVYGALYAVVPGFDAFRSPARHMFQAQLYIALLAGLGCDALQWRGVKMTFMAFAAPLAGAVTLAGAAWLRYAPQTAAEAFWTGVLRSLNVAGEARWSSETANVGASALHAAGALCIAGLSLLIVAAALAMSRRRHAARYAIVIVGVVELLAFARAHRPSFDLADVRRTQLESELMSAQGDFRVFVLAQENYPLEIGAYFMWRHDSIALMRYVDLVAFTQNTRAEFEPSEFTFKWFHPLYQMFRCQFIIDSRKSAGRVMLGFSGPMPRALLIHEYSVEKEKEDQLALLADPAFNPRETVVLETEPEPKPGDGGGPGAVHVRDVSTDEVIIDVDTPTNAILLITDSSRPTGALRRWARVRKADTRFCRPTMRCVQFPLWREGTI